MSRIDSLPPSLCTAIDEAKAAARAAGRPVVDLGVGDPDRPTPAALVARLAREAVDPAGHRYPAQYGDPDFRRAAADWPVLPSFFSSSFCLASRMAMP